MTAGERLKKALGLFLTFFKIGCFTFGGGWSIVAQLQKIYVEDKKIITSEELLDLTSVGRSLPGTMIGNVAMFFGSRVCGPLGGVACILGMILPPFIIIAVITFFYSAFRDNVWVAAAMNGVRAAVVPIIFSAALAMVKSAFKYLVPCLIVFAFELALYLIFHLSCVYLVLIGAACGLLISEICERRKASK